MKLKFKFLITIFTLFLLLLTSICFATNYNDEIMLISDTTQTQDILKDSDLYDDLYVADESEYEIKNTINGNSFISVDTLNITPNSNGGIIQGNLFVTANNVNIKSDVTYSDTEKDDLGNPVITINNYSAISGNVFAVAEKFVLEPGSEINGDLFICADEVYLEQNSKINGNIFIYSNKFVLNAEIGGSLYAQVQNFDMKYFAFISRDLHLTSEEVILNGWIYRNSFITTKNIITQDKFINQGNFTLTDADSFIFSGEILGNATINSKEINFNNENNSTCKIAGNLSYSSKNEFQIPQEIVAKEITYSKYSNTTSKNIITNIFDYILNLIGLLILAHVIYVLLSKFVPKYLDKISNISALNILKYLGIGLGFLLLIPIVSLLLLLSNVGMVLGLILLLLYIIMLLITKSIFIIAMATFVKTKFKKDFNIYLYILAIDIILSLLTLIPYAGFIISILVSLIGFGMIIKR